MLNVSRSINMFKLCISILESGGLMVCFLLRLPEFIQPVKERPRTDSAVARRMVTRALGMQGRGRRGQHY